MHDSPIGLCNFLLQVECYGPVNQLVGVAKQHKGVELQSSLQSQNGDVERHEKKSCEGRHPTLDKNAAENGLPRQSGCRAESSSDSSLSPSLENGFVTSQDSEKYEEETLPTLPRKKRGRRKLERPTKCELYSTFLSIMFHSCLLTEPLVGPRPRTCHHNDKKKKNAIFIHKTSGIVKRFWWLCSYH